LRACQTAYQTANPQKRTTANTCANFTDSLALESLAFGATLGAALELVGLLVVEREEELRKKS